MLWHRGPVRVWLVLVMEQLWNEPTQVVLVDDDLVVIGAEAFGDKPRIVEFVVAGVSLGCGGVRPYRPIHEL